MSASVASQFRGESRELPPETVQYRGVIELRGIVKRFGALVANDRIDLDVRPGEIHAIVGQNGAGKTTLMRILFGLIKPDAGSIAVAGMPVSLRSPGDALALGIGMVHQHFLLVPAFSVAENVVLGSARHRTLRFDRSVSDPDVVKLAAEIGLEVDPSELVANLPIDVQQRVEILKLLYRGATTLILDEPTASLGPRQMRGLFGTLLDLRGRGRSIVIVTHKLSEVVEFADRVTVIRQGKVVSAANRGSFDEDALALAMLGGELPEPRPRRAGNTTERGPVQLRLTGVVVAGDRGENALDGINLTASAGEIVGVAGVEGNGQRELAEFLAGLRTAESGTVEINGVVPQAWNPRTLRQLGLGVCTEDRHRWDLFLDLSVADNLAAVDIVLGTFKDARLLPRSAIKRSADRLLREYAIEPPDPQLMVASLSGGNQQKLILARELARKPRLFIAAQPTRGLDVGSSLYVHDQFIKLRDEGCCTVLISHDLDEIMKLADRVVVLFRGKVAYADRVENVTLEQVARAMAGLDLKVSAC